MLFASIVPCFIMTGLVFTFSAYCFFLVGKMCLLTDCLSYKGLWNKAFDGKYGYLVDIMICSNAIMGCAAFLVLLGDFGKQVLQNLGFTGYAITEKYIIIYCQFLLNLMILPENLDMLKPLTALAFVAIIYFSIYSIYIGMNYLIGGYPKEVEVYTKKLVEHTWVFRTAWLAPFSTLSSSFSAHYNAPRFLMEMQNPTESNFKKATWTGFNLSLLMNVLIMFFGFVSINNYGFKEMNSSGNIIKIYGKMEGKKISVLLCGLLYKNKNYD
jgi:amino acid permease